jgi:MFS family permease
MMAIFMAAVEVTIVATAMPTIVADLGGARYFSWVFAAYLLHADLWTAGGHLWP